MASKINFGGLFEMPGFVERIIPHSPKAKVITVSPWGLDGDIDILAKDVPGAALFGNPHARTGYDLTIQMLYQPGANTAIGAANSYKALMKKVIEVNRFTGTNRPVTISGDNFPDITFADCTFHGFMARDDVGWVDDLINQRGFWCKGEARFHCLNASNLT